MMYVGQKLFRACVISVVISIPTLNKTYYYIIIMNNQNSGV